MEAYRRSSGVAGCVHRSFCGPTPKRTRGICFQFDLSGYPDLALTARLWDTQKGESLIREKWPGGKGRVIAAFNPDWNAGTAVYLPCGTAALVGH